jgi:transcriptional regulator with XRE-family HTH domain|uniref:Repressor protein CI n=1 Tax=virus sp. ctyMK1 TaxID=2828002 RepID=A0A8S5REF3_9VIRU|nr:MAG TPA: Repressor protein CI [virus sp. ctyMK1]
MGIGKRIKEARNNLGLTQEELAKMLGITKGAIANYENETSHPKEPIMYKLFKVLKVDANYLFQDVVNVPKKTNNVTLSEFNIIKKYRKLDDFGKETVNISIDRELQRTVQLKGIKLENNSFVYEENTIYLPEIYSRFSAGGGQYDTDSGYEMIQVPFSTEAAQANYVITVSGHSMEPEYFNGERVFIKSMPDIEIGEIGAWQINNELFIKQKGINELISLNTNYDNIQINEYDNVSCLGKVIGKL